MEVVGTLSETKKLLCIVIVLIRFCGAQHLICNVTQGLDRTLYSVPEPKASECSYSWMNSTGHVVANEKRKMDHLVLDSSISTLVTRMCLVQLNYSRDCVSEVIQHTAYCFTDCEIPGPLKTKETPRQYWGTITVSVMVLALLICSAFKRRRNRHSTDDVEAQNLHNEQRN